MTDTSPPTASSGPGRLRNSTTALVAGALVIALLGFLAGAFATPGYRGDQWRYGHMYGYNGGFPGGMMGGGSYDSRYPGGMMGWGPYDGSNGPQRREVRVDAGQVRSVSGNTVTLTNGGTVKLTPNTFIVVHTTMSKK
jgi:hypothetical protein